MKNSLAQIILKCSYKCNKTTILADRFLLGNLFYMDLYSIFPIFSIDQLSNFTSLISISINKFFKSFMKRKSNVSDKFKFHGFSYFPIPSFSLQEIVLKNSSRKDFNLIFSIIYKIHFILKLLF